MIKPSRSAISAMVLAASTLVGLAVSEGYSDKAIIPIPGDVPTIGFGRTDGVKMGDKTTPVRSLIQLMDEVEGVYVNGLKKCITAPLYDHEFAAYISLSYNIGISAFCKSTLVKKLNAEDYQGACSEITRWNKANGKVEKGLTNRRKIEREQCEGNES